MNILRYCIAKLSSTELLIHCGTEKKLIKMFEHFGDTNKRGENDAIEND